MTLSMELFYHYGLIFLFFFAVINSLVLIHLPAPYGRHARPGWGPSFPNGKWAWVIIEAPVPLVFLYFFVAGRNAMEPAALILCFLFQAHYLYRAFIFPLRMRGAKPKPLLTMLIAIVFNVTNAALNAWAIATLADQLDNEWLRDPRFLAGVALFVLGYAINHHSDAILRNLRAPHESGYKIPHGGLFRWITCPNYFGELIEWIGFALAAWTWPALAFAAFTASNLIPRAVTHHRWYHEKFPEYPKDRKAILPGIL